VTASPTKVNGVKRPAVPVLGEWQPISFDRGATVWEKQATPEPNIAEALLPPAVDPRAEAEAEAIRARTAAETKAALILAEAEADAIRAQGDAKAEQQRITNERATMRLAKEKAENDAKIAEATTRQKAAERQTEAEEERAEAEKQAGQEERGKREQSAKSWRFAALGFAIACAVVALPVQMSAFWDPSQKWLLAAPVMLEGGAWVVLRGAAAAVDDHRPHWHYRLIAWLLAFVAAAINLSHGLSHFGMATAAGTAFASLAGPGVWDLHEHGRIRLRDGVLTRRERKAKERDEKRAVAARVAEKRFAAEREAYREKAIREQLDKLAKSRKEKLKDVWEHAEYLAAALGETTVTEAVWRRAHKDVKGTDPGDSPEAQQLRNLAARRMLDARADAPDSSVWKIASSQHASQVLPSVNKRRYSPPATSGVRRKGDVPKFVDAARKQASIAAKRPADNPAN
jgi:chemotaxis protein histidine kinase CheA